MNDRAACLTTMLLSAVLLLVCVIAMVNRPDRQGTLQATEIITYRIDPNVADVPTLCLLPRIGPDIAQRLINDRQTHGRFRDANDLTRVPMIGEKTVAALEPWLKFEGQE